MHCGFANAFIVPVPPSADRGRVGALYLVSDAPAAFDGGAVEARRPWARVLANEVHDWWCKWLRAELLARSGLTDDEIDLLKRQAAGQCSKVIATALGTTATAIDCRFQRVNAKLGVSTRREAARLARLHR